MSSDLLWSDTQLINESSGYFLLKNWAIERHEKKGFKVFPYRP